AESTHPLAYLIKQLRRRPARLATCRLPRPMKGCHPCPPSVHMARLGCRIRLRQEGQVVDLRRVTAQAENRMPGLGCCIRLHFEIYLALGGCSCWFFAACVSLSFALACRPSRQQLLAQHRRKPGHSELV